MSKDISNLLFKDSYTTYSRRPWVRSSSIGMCKRRIAYQIMGYQPAPDASHFVFTLMFGNAIHDMLQRKLVKMGWIKAKPVLSKDGSIDWEQTDDPLSGCELRMLDQDKRIVGHCDGVTVPLTKDKNGNFQPDPNGKRYLIEIKSITDRNSFWVLGIRDGGIDDIDEADNPPEFIELDDEKSSGSGNRFQKISRFSHTRRVRGAFGVSTKPVYKLKIGGKDELVTVCMIGNSTGSFTSLKAPKPEHVLQASVYANYFNVEDILFLYVGKDVNVRSYSTGVDELLNCPVKMLEYHVTEEDLSKAYTRIEEVYHYVDQGELPPRDYQYEESRSECKLCPFAWQCYPDKVNAGLVDNVLSTLNLKPMQSGPGVIEVDEDFKFLLPDREPAQDLQQDV